MTTAEDRVWEAVKYTFFCSREDYFRGIEGWEIAEGSYGIRLNHGPEFHWLPCGKLSKLAVRECIQPLIDRHGYALTRTPDPRQQKFNERIGFYRIGENGDEILYRIDALAF